MRTYILRTEGWDDYPNGRWGDSRSPAYGDLAAFGHATGFARTVSFHWCGGRNSLFFANADALPISNPQTEECIEVWGHPKTLQDVSDLFSRYVQGDLASLPWSDTQLKPESSVIQQNLAELNKIGYLTINSQPAVDGAESEDPRFGWGPQGGWVYQKAYLEFFLSKERLDCLVAEMKKDPMLTFYAVNAKVGLKSLRVGLDFLKDVLLTCFRSNPQGELQTNSSSDSATALTWGVFPGRELIQPTILEKVSFLAWKDEAFHLWGKWADLYAEGSESNKVLKGIQDDWWLCCVADNNYKAPRGAKDVVSGGRFYELLSRCAGK